MTVFEWNSIKRRLNKACRDAYETRDFARAEEVQRLRREHDAFRPIVEAETQRVKAMNRALDAARKSGKAPVIRPRSQEPEWEKAERRYADLVAIERLMGHRTGVNVGHPGPF